jgi:hypothetical protein
MRTVLNEGQGRATRNETYNRNMNDEELFGPTAQQKRILAQLREIAKALGVRNVKELVPGGPMNAQVADQLSKHFAKLGAPPMLLGVIGSWGDTLAPDAIEDLLENGYEMDTIFASTSD